MRILTPLAPSLFQVHKKAASCTSPFLTNCRAQADFTFLIAWLRIPCAAKHKLVDIRHSVCLALVFGRFQTLRGGRS